jgi:glycosyltransferase involved in cell wall biosynthesis
MSGSAPRPPKLAILTNLLAPYRVPIFQSLTDHFEVTVLYSGEEGNRGQWRGLENQVYDFNVERVKGLTYVWTKRSAGTALDTRYLHVNPALVSALLRLQPDAIITDEMGFRSLVALAYGRLFRRPVWVWWGGTPHTERGIGPAKRLFRQRFAPRVRRWFSYGMTSTEYLVSLGVDSRRVVELQNCVQESRFLDRVAPAYALDPRPVLLCVGRLVPGKGVDLFLRAAAAAQAEGQIFSILVVGDGPARQFLGRTVTELGLSNVHFRDAHTPDGMAAVYRSGDVLVFPTLDDVWGLVVNEALWSGLPALVSVYAGCARELVPPESTFDPLDPADFSAKLSRAVAGQLPPPDRTRLRRVGEVSRTILRELNTALRAAHEDPARP